MKKHALLFAILGLFLLQFASVSAATITIGETAITPNTDSGNANLLLAQQTTLSQSATVQSVSFYVVSAAGKLRLGIYNAAGPGGGPGSKVAETAEFTPVAGWNTAAVVSPTLLPAGTYWLAYLTNNNSLTFKNDQTGSDKYYSYTYAAMPATFATSPTSGVFHFSLYATLSTTPDTTAPSTPTNLAAKALSSSQIGLTWATSTDNVAVAGYKVFRNNVQVATSSATSFTDTGLTAVTTYTYAVAAFDAAQNVSAQSTQVATTTLPQPVQDTQPPTGSVLINADAAATKTTSVTLSLNATDTQNAVTQMRFSNTGTSFNAAVAYATTSAWTLATTDGTKTVYVQFKDAAGNWSGSFTDTIVLDTVAPTISGVSSSSVTGSSATITWTTNEPATSQVEYGTTTAYGTLTAIDGALVTAHSVVLTGLSPSKTYNFRVRSKDAATNEKIGGNLMFKTANIVDTVAPSVPANLSAIFVASSQISLAWDASTDNVGVTGYKVYRDGVFVSNASTNAFTDAGLTATTTYAYAVSAFDAAGNISAQSASISTTTMPQPVQSTSTTPTLIQYVASSANPDGLGISGNNFKIPLPNNVAGGDCLVLAMTYPQGSLPTVTDNNGNVWPTSPAVAANPGAGGYVSSLWVLPNAKPGQTRITVSFPSAVIPFNYAVSEFNNIDPVSPVNGTSAVTNAAGPSLSTGSFTPGNNDLGGGNIILNYYALSSIANGNPTSWVSGSGFTLLDADISWISKQGFPHASEYMLQTSASAVNPSITATGDSADRFNGVAIALKAAANGGVVPVGIHINKIIHQTTNLGTASWTLQEPATGNLRVLATANGNNLTNITSVTDNTGGTWTKIEPQSDEPQMWYSANTTPNPNLAVTLHISGANPTMSVLFYDIAGAAASPLDVVAGTPTVDSTNQTVLVNSPTITPTTPDGVTIAVVGLGQGPGTGLTAAAPAGSVFDLVTYTGELDFDLMENADGQAHAYYSTTATQNWGWNISATSPNSTFSTAASFKAAAH